MKFTTPINRSRKDKDKDWNEVAGNTRVGDGQEGAEATFSPRASDLTILRSYLKTYQLSIDEDVDNSRWMEITIHKRPGSEDGGGRYYVQPLLDRSGNYRFALVTDRVPDGEMRWDGYVY